MPIHISAEMYQSIVTSSYEIYGIDDPDFVTDTELPYKKYGIPFLRTFFIPL